MNLSRIKVSTNKVAYLRSLEQEITLILSPIIMDNELPVGELAPVKKLKCKELGLFTLDNAKSSFWRGQTILRTYILSTWITEVQKYRLIRVTPKYLLRTIIKTRLEYKEALVVHILAKNSEVVLLITSVIRIASRSNSYQSTFKAKRWKTRLESIWTWHIITLIVWLLLMKKE